MGPLTFGLLRFSAVLQGKEHITVPGNVVGNRETSLEHLQGSCGLERLLSYQQEHSAREVCFPGDASAATQLPKHVLCVSKHFDSISSLSWNSFLSEPLARVSFQEAQEAVVCV